MKTRYFVNTATKEQYDRLFSFITENGHTRDTKLFLRGKSDTVNIITSYEELAQAAGEIILDSSMHIWNHEAICAINELGYSPTGFIGSYELTQRELADIKTDLLITPVYGYVPLMRTKNCVRLTNNACTKESGFVNIVDRKGILFPVECDCSRCINIIYNSVPLSLHNILKKQSVPGAGYYISFTIESPKESVDILKYYYDITLDSIERPCPIPSHTTGHFKKPVL